MRKQVEQKLREFEAMDVIERVTGPTPWVSSLLVVHGKKEPRQPIPTIDDILEVMTGATVFFKTGFKNGDIIRVPAANYIHHTHRAVVVKETDVWHFICP